MNPRDIDPELNYCPRCGDEYRAEITTCAACGVDLVLGRTILAATTATEADISNIMPIGPDETVVSVRRGPVRQIRELRDFLWSRGLPSLIFKEQGGGCGCRGPEVILQIRDEDVPRVMAALAEEHWRNTGLAGHDTRNIGSVFDDREEEALCPACGYRFSTRETTCPDCGLCFG